MFAYKILTLSISTFSCVVRIVYHKGTLPHTYTRTRTRKITFAIHLEFINLHNLLTSSCSLPSLEYFLKSWSIVREYDYVSCRVCVLLWVNAPNNIWYAHTIFSNVFVCWKMPYFAVRFITAIWYLYVVWWCSAILQQHQRQQQQEKTANITVWCYHFISFSLTWMCLCFVFLRVMRRHRISFNIFTRSFNNFLLYFLFFRFHPFIRLPYFQVLQRRVVFLASIRLRHRHYTLHTTHYCYCY